MMHRRSCLLWIPAALASLIWFLPGSRAAFVDDTGTSLPNLPAVTYAVTVVDVNGDGAPDLALPVNGQSQLLINQGDGTFADETATRLPVDGAATLAIATADVDGDGDADLLLVNAGGANRLLINDGSGVFADESATRLPAASRISVWAAFGDVDNDQDPDVVIANRNSAAQLLINDGSGAFTDESDTRLPAAEGATTSVALVDVDAADGPDLVFTSEWTGTRLLLNDGGGSFADVTAARLPAGMTTGLHVTAADVNGDGAFDLLVAGGALSVRLLLNDGAGSFADVTAARLPPTSDFVVKVRVGDADYDGSPDLFLSNMGADRLLLNDGSGTFVDGTVEQLPADSGRTFGAAFVDVDDDLDLDLVLARPGARDRLLINAIAFPRVVITASPALVEVGDTVTIGVRAVDEDGIADLTVTIGGDDVVITGGVGHYQPQTAGDFVVTAVAEDTTGATGQGTATFQAVPNVTPMVNAGPNGAVLVGEPFASNGSFADPGEDTWTGTVDYGDGSGVDALPLAGDKSFVLNHTYADAGSFVVTVTVSDSVDTGTDSAIVTVTHPPVVITSTPTVQAREGQQYTYDVDATGPAGGADLVFSLDTSPAGMTIDPVTGLIQWVPTAEQTGQATIDLRAADPPTGQSDVQTFTLRVLGIDENPDIEPPIVRLTLEPSTVAVGQPVTISVEAADDKGPLALELTVDGSPLTLDAMNQAMYVPPSSGGKLARAVATDGAGNTAAAQDALVVFNAADETPPTAQITAPASDSVLEAPTTIMGTASDTNLVKYTLAVREAGTEEPFRDFAQGFASVDNGPLGQLDTSLIPSGFYDVQLQVVDVGGNVVTSTVQYEVLDDRVLGNFELTEVDIRLPVGGIPMEVVRRYDTRVRHLADDFGHGWGLQVDAVGFSQTRQPGFDWYLFNTGTFLPNYVYRSSRLHVIAFRLADGQVERFAFTPYAIDPVFQPNYGVANFTRLPGTTATLEIIGNNGLFLNSGHLLNDSTFEIYNPERYRLTLANGTEVVFNRKEGRVESITDPNGESLTIGPNGLAHSSGYTTQFQRDGDKRITRVTDPAGNAFDYAYDEAGDLVSVTDPESNTTEYEYDFTHRLKTIRRPDGTTQKAKYDQDGRWIGFIDQYDKLTRFEHDPGNGQTMLTDPLGEDFLFEYDTDGNITGETDALGNQTVRTFNADGLLLTETDPEGYTVAFEYDAAGNITKFTDAEGNATNLTYNSRGQPLTYEGPLGGEVGFSYDAKGGITGIVDPAGMASQTLVTNERGRPTAITSLGETIHITYDAAGRRQAVDFDGATPRTFEYDANGELTRESSQRTLSDGTVVPMQQTLTRDGRGRITALTDWRGNTHAYEFGPTGDISSITDADGGEYGLQYDPGGNPTRVDYPDGNFEEYTYDSGGRLIAVTDRGGRTRQYEYDAVGNQTKAILPDGSTKTYVYDKVGNLVGRTDGENRTVTSEYNGNRQPTALIDPLGNRTEYDYDAAGRLVSLTDALNRVTQQQYTYVGGQVALPTVLTHPDGTTVTRAYAGTVLPATITDEAGHQTAYTYDAHRNVASVTDPEGNSGQFQYDEHGHVLKYIDANGNEVTYDYDNAGNLTQRAFPLGQQETWTYTPGDETASYTDPNGQTTTYQYDAMGRQTRETVGAVDVQRSYSPTGRVAEIVTTAGTTSFTYDTLDRLTGAAYPDGATFAYTYDDSGELTSITTSGGTTAYEYDGASRLIKVTAPGNRVFEYTYDAVGNMLTKTLPTGVTISYTYDPRDRVTAVEHRNAASALLWSVNYTLDPTGRRTQAVESSGRTVDWDYDDAGKLLRETVTVGGTPTVTAYTYDAVGNRLTKTTGAGTVTYTYDANDRLTGTDAGTSFTYDANGDLTAKSTGAGDEAFTYDELNRLVQYEAADGTVTSYEYDGSGLLLERTTDGVVTHYEWNHNDLSGLPQLSRIVEDGVVTDLVRGREWLVLDTAAGAEYVHTDGLGSVRALTDGAQSVVGTADYAAFGNAESAAGTASPVGFAGEYRDEASGLIYLRARWYDPETGRFITPDPFHGHRNDPRTLHRYLYAGADPVNHTDPSGEFTLGSISISISIQSVLATIAVVKFFKLLPGDVIKDIKEVLEKIPGLKLSPAVDHAYKTLAQLTGEKTLKQWLEKWFGKKTGKQIAKQLPDAASKYSVGPAGLWHWNCRTWLTYLPEDGDYFECDFNAFVTKIYMLQIVNKRGGKFTAAFKIIGYYLSYFSYLELMVDTLEASVSGHLPPQPTDAENFNCLEQNIQ